MIFTSYPYCLYESQMPKGSFRRMAIALVMFFVMLIMMSAFAIAFGPNPDLVWFMPLFPIGCFKLGLQSDPLKQFSR